MRKVWIIGWAKVMYNVLNIFSKHFKRKEYGKENITLLA